MVYACNMKFLCLLVALTMCASCCPVAPSAETSAQHAAPNPIQDSVNRTVDLPTLFSEASVLGGRGKKALWTRFVETALEAKDREKELEDLNAAISEVAPDRRGRIVFIEHFFGYPGQRLRYDRRMLINGWNPAFAFKCRAFEAKPVEEPIKWTAIWKRAESIIQKGSTSLGERGNAPEATAITMFDGAKWSSVAAMGISYEISTKNNIAARYRMLLELVAEEDPDFWEFVTRIPWQHSSTTGS